MSHALLNCIIREESTNERYCDTVKDLLLLNTVSQKDEKPHTAELNDTVTATFKLKLQKYCLKKSSNVNPNVPLREVFCQNCPDSDHQDMSMCIFQPLTVGCLDTGLEKVMSSSPGQVDFLLSSVGYWYPIKHYVRALRLLITHLPGWSQE